MSGTANEFENPGGNYPDRQDTDGAPAQPADQRSDAGVGGKVYDEGDGRNAAASGEAVQDEPVLEQNNATTQDKLDGIAAQTRVDLGDESQDRYEEVLRQRLDDAGIQLTDDDVSKLARRSGDAGSGGGSGV
jgi:3-oxoacyl-ACP reductase-like protein